MYYTNKYTDIKYLSKKAGSFSGVPQSTVQLWTEKGIVQADEETSGTGDRRKYGVIGCFQIGIAKELRNQGLSIKQIQNIMQRMLFKKNLEKHLQEEEHTFLIIRLDNDQITNVVNK